MKRKSLVKMKLKVKLLMRVVKMMKKKTITYLLYNLLKQRWG